MGARTSNVGWPRLFTLGAGATTFEVFLGEREATEPIGYDTSFDPKSGCRRPCFDRTLSLARSPLRPKRSAYGLAGLRSDRASESVKPGGGPNESIEVGKSS